MGNIIPFKNIDISKISDDLFDEIENYLKECFNKEIRKSSGNIPIFEAKKNAIKLVSKKFNLTLENAIEIVREIELRDLDNNLKP
jgi:aspartyl/asparaginyl-tRNA synthetase